MKRFLVFALFTSFALCADENPWWAIGGQSTWIFQGNTAVSGTDFNPTLSFGDKAGFGWSGTISLYGAASPWNGALFAVQPEYANGHGMPNASGVAAYPDGEIIRTGTLGPNPPPYIARLYYHQTIALGTEVESVDSQYEDRFMPYGATLAKTRPASRVEITLGRFALNDFFDASKIANDARHHFLNLALMEQGAWDYAADTRGYTNSAVIALETPNFALRAGFAMMPTLANGPDLDWDLAHSRSEIVEAEGRFKVWGQPGSLKALLYFNQANMGTYATALLQSGTPDITKTRAPGTLKWGGGLLWDQQIVDGIDTFFRIGANDGQTETFAFTEIDRSISFGAMMSGSLWNRANDHLALGVEVGGLSDVHAQYLSRGGVGFQLGDGSLNYAPETIIETYYSLSALENVQVTGDVQLIINPGMNADHGITSIFGLRLHGHF